jgi:hypothetical protein
MILRTINNIRWVLKQVTTPCPPLYGLAAAAPWAATVPFPATTSHPCRSPPTSRPPPPQRWLHGREHHGARTPSCRPRPCLCGRVSRLALGRPHERPPPQVARLTPALRSGLHGDVSWHFPSLALQSQRTWGAAVYSMASNPPHLWSPWDPHLLFPLLLLVCALQVLDEMPKGLCLLILHPFSAFQSLAYHTIMYLSFSYMWSWFL